MDGGEMQVTYYKVWFTDGMEMVISIDRSPLERIVRQRIKECVRRHGRKSSEISDWEMIVK